jgi:hypothetical protein
MHISEGAGQPAGEDAVPGLPEVGVESPHAADQDRHLGYGQRQHVVRQTLPWHTADIGPNR